MACHVVRDPNFFNGTPVFCCGPSEVRKKCRFCEGRAALSLRDWPMIKPIKFEPCNAIGADDVLAQPGGWRARILEVTNRVSHRGDVVDVRALVLNLGPWAGSGKPKRPFETEFPISAANLHKFRVERPSICDAPCCFRHRRHIGVDRDYCMEHWTSWESVR